MIDVLSTLVRLASNRQAQKHKIAMSDVCDFDLTLLDVPFSDFADCDFTDLPPPPKKPYPYKPPDQNPVPDSILAPASLEKCAWVENIWKDWINARKDQYPEDTLLEVSIEQLFETFRPVANEYLLKFFTEVRRKDAKEYNPRTLHQISILIQMILNNKGITANILKDLEFRSFQRCLHGVLVKLAPLATPKRKAEVILPRNGERTLE